MQTGEGFVLLQQRQRRRDQHYLAGLFFAGLLVFLLSLCTGEAWIWPHQWLSEAGRLFVWQLRLPRALAVIMVGASLAVSGAVMQALFNNPLAEPGLLGVANGAAVASMLTLLLSDGLLPQGILSLSAIGGAGGMTLLLLIFAQRELLSNAHLLLVGSVIVNVVVAQDVKS